MRNKILLGERLCSEGTRAQLRYLMNQFRNWPVDIEAHEFHRRAKLVPLVVVDAEGFDGNREVVKKATLVPTQPGKVEVVVAPQYRDINPVERISLLYTEDDGRGLEIDLRIKVRGGDNVHRARLEVYNLCPGKVFSPVNVDEIAKDRHRRYMEDFSFYRLSEARS